MENTDNFAEQFEGLPTPEKIRLLSESKHYKDRLDPLHQQAVNYMIELHSGPSSSEPVALPDNLTDIMAHPAFTDRMHSDHRRIMEKFRQLHNIK